MTPSVRYLEEPLPGRVRDLISGRHGTVRFFTPANEPWHPGGIPAVVADFERRIEFWHQTEPCK